MASLVTGATGFIGSHLVRLLLDRGEEVVTITRASSDPTNLEGLETRKLRRVTGDLLDPASVRRALEGCDVVYHLAGMVATKPSLKEAVYASNLTATVGLFEACREARPKKIVYLASIFALGAGDRDHPADERADYNLSDMAARIDYFDAKRKAELEAYRFLQAGLPLVFVYPCYCLGPGDVYLSSSQAVVASMRGLLLGVVDGGLNILDVRDAARGLALGMDRGKVGEKYLLGDHNLTWRDLGTALAKVTRRPPPRLVVPGWVVRALGWGIEKSMGRWAPFDSRAALVMSRYWYYDASKARRELGFEGRPLEETLRDAVAWFRTHRVRLAR